MRKVPVLPVLIVALSSILQGQGLTPAHVAKLTQVTGVHVSPDGAQVAFTRMVPRPIAEGPGGARAHLYVLDLKAEKPRERLLVGGKRSVSGVAWRPDGRRITFLMRGKGQPRTEVWGLDPAGGEPQRITGTERGVRAYAWSPDGTRIAFSMIDAMPELRRKARAMGFKQTVKDEDWRPVSLWVVDAAGGKPRRLTSDLTVNGFAWGPGGKQLLAAMAPRNLVDDRYMFTRLWLVPAAGGDARKLVDNPGKLGAWSWSPDGKQVAYVAAEDRNDPHAGMLFVQSTSGGKPRELTRGLEGMVHDVHWEGPGTILGTVSVGVYTHVWSFDAGSGKSTIRVPGGDVAFRAVERAGDRFVVAGSTAREPAEVWTLDSGGATRLTDGNPWLKEVRLGRQEVVKIKARDGLAIEGLLMYPLAYEKGRRYPLVQLIHGGPESHFSAGWNTSYSGWGQMLSARGYFAWYPNYRSSTGYGVAFAKADHGDPMGGEFEDHLDAIKDLAGRGLVDPARVGLGGGSYGGYTAAWAATRHSEHFAACVSFVPFTDIRTKWLTSDIPNEFHRVHYQDRWPHEQVEFLASRSPLTWAPKCRTPLLLLGGTSDPRVHPSQPFMLYSAVKFATDTPVRYVQYPGEGHGNRINVYRFDYSVRALRWFDHYLRPGNHRNDPPPPLDIDYDHYLGDG